MDVLTDLYHLIRQRKDHPQEGSYTSYLFEKGREKILKKVGEESSEVLIAAMKSDSQELVSEVGDLLYHLLVLLAQEDISWLEVTQEMEKRRTKIGNRKEERRGIQTL